MVDRVGNVLAVFEMNNAAKVVMITSSHNGATPVLGGLEAVNVIPARLAAIAKAITGVHRGQRIQRANRITDHSREL